MAYYCRDDEATSRNKVKDKLIAAKQAAFFAFGREVKDPELELEFLSYALKADGEYASSRGSILGTVMIVSTLLLGITVALLLNPQVLTPEGAVRNQHNHYVRMAFYGNFFATANFLTSIILAVTTLMKQTWAVMAEYDAPAFFWHTSYLYTLTWVCMVVGVSSFLFAICVTVLATYVTADAWFGVAAEIVIIVFVNFLIWKYHQFWANDILKKRLVSARASALFDGTNLQLTADSQQQ